MQSLPIGQSSASRHGTSGKRILFAMVSAYIVLVLYFIAHDYYFTIRRSKEESLERLHAISHSSARLINGDEHELLTQKYHTKDAITRNTQDSLYLRLHNTLSYVQEINQLETPVYTFVLDSSSRAFYFVGTSSKHPSYFHPYQSFPQAILDKYDVGGELDVYEDKNGVWLSSFAPIKNSIGNTVAMLQVDQNFRTFLAKAQRSLIWNTLISLTIIIPFGFVLSAYVSRMLKKQMTTQKLLSKQNEEIKIQHELIEKQNQQLDKRVRLRTAELEELNQELSGFLYHSSHDVQAPIATLKGLFSLAAKDLLPNPIAEAYLQRMCLTTERLEKITKTIKLVHEIKMSALKPAHVLLKGLVGRVIYFLDIPEEDLTVDIDIPEDYKVISDREILHHVFFELVRNAHQYRRQDTSEPSRVTISLLSYQKDITTVVIDDNGEGMAPYIRKNMFFMFTRGSERSYGMGMGLSIVKSCLEKIQSHIDVIDKEDPGTKFILYISNLDND